MYSQYHWPISTLLLGILYFARQYHSYMALSQPVFEVLPTLLCDFKRQLLPQLNSLIGCTPQMYQFFQRKPQIFYDFRFGLFPGHLSIPVILHKVLFVYSCSVARRWILLVKNCCSFSGKKISDRRYKFLVYDGISVLSIGQCAIYDMNVIYNICWHILPDHNICRIVVTRVLSKCKISWMWHLTYFLSSLPNTDILVLSFHISCFHWFCVHMFFFFFSLYSFLPLLSSGNLVF